MSTTATVKIVVRDFELAAETVDREPKERAACLFQFADGYDDVDGKYSPRTVLQLAVELAEHEFDVREINAWNLAATYESIIDEDLPDGRQSYVRYLGTSVPEDYRGNYAYLLEVTVDAFTDSLQYRILGPADFR